MFFLMQIIFIVLPSNMADVQNLCCMQVAPLVKYNVWRHCRWRLVLALATRCLNYQLESGWALCDKYIIVCAKLYFYIEIQELDNRHYKNPIGSCFSLHFFRSVAAPCVLQQNRARPRLLYLLITRLLNSSKNFREKNHLILCRDGNAIWTLPRHAFGHRHLFVFVSIGS